MAERVDLSQIPEKELRLEIAKRERDRLAAAEKERETKVQYWMGNLGVLLGLAPKHVMGGCSDDKTVNKDRGCIRCILLYAQEYNWWPEEWVVEIRAAQYIPPKVSMSVDG